MRGTKRTVVLLAAILPAGCAMSTTPSARSHSAEVASSVVLAGELARFAHGMSLLTALEVARPWFLSVRGAVPTVSIDGSSAMELSWLRTISVTDVHEVRLIRAGRNLGRPAIMPNGDVVDGAVILVVTRKR